MEIHQVCQHLSAEISRFGIVPRAEHFVTVEKSVIGWEVVYREEHFGITRIVHF
jgi:hypothetical protein